MPKREVIDSRKIYYIGGAPCSYKSSIAEKLAKEFKMYYFKCDDNTSDYIEAGASLDIEICTKLKKMSLDEALLGRSAEEQKNDEFEFFRKTLDMLLDDIDVIESDRIIVEGCNILPDIASEYGMKNYVCLVPTKEFQLAHHAERPWVKETLNQLSDSRQGYFNWMEKDILFSQKIISLAKEEQKPCIIIDETKSFKEIYQQVKEIFKLTKK